jgi:hypothetical protein
MLVVFLTAAAVLRFLMGGSATPYSMLTADSCETVGEKDENE